MLRVGSLGAKQALLTGGYAQQTQFGGDGVPDALTELAAYGVYALLIPEAAGQISLSAQKGDAEFTASVETLNDGAVLYVREPGLTVHLNQQQAPSGDSFGGQQWTVLGQIVVTADDATPDSPAIQVLIASSDGGLISADGVRLRKVEPVMPELRLLTLTDNPLDDRAHDIFIDQIDDADTDVEFDPNQAPAVAPVVNQGSQTALAFDGNDRVTVSASASLQMTGSSTVEVRFKYDAASIGWQQLVHKTAGDGFGQRGYSLWVNQSDGQMFLSTADGLGDQFWYLQPGTVQAGKWYEFASVIDRASGTVRAYLNGTEVLSAGVRANAALGAGNNLYIGGGTGGGFGTGFRGTIEDVAVWNEARSFAEVKSDFLNGVQDADAALALHLRFNESAGDFTPADSSTHANSAFRTGGAPVFGPIRLNVGDTPGDPLDVLVSSDDAGVTVTYDGTYLLVTPAVGFSGTARITVTARDGTGAAHDFRGRQDSMTFDVSFGVNALYGTKYNDIDGDGVRDTGEPGLDGVKIFLDADADGVLDAGEQFTWTDANGDYAFRDLPFVAPSAFGPAVVLAAAPATPTGGAGSTTVNAPVASTVTTGTTATFQLSGEFTGAG
ncbi:MAG TPA: LamG-like jellyroll fold domain-containing protein, partial [Candidatus Limnocylindrales bacterium]